MKRSDLVFLAICVVTGPLFYYLSVAHADGAPAAEKYELTEIQKLRLEVKQKDAIIAQRDLGEAQARFNQTINDFNAEVKAIKKENNWPDDVQPNPQTLDFSAPRPPVITPAPPAPKPSTP